MSTFEHAYDDRAETWMQVGDTTKAIAEHYCGVKIDTTTHERWRQTFGLMREIDTLADDTDITHDEVIEKLADFSEFAERYPILAPGVLEPEPREAMIRRTQYIFKLGHYASLAETLPRYTGLRLNEGRMSAKFLSDTATAFVTSQPRFHDEYMPVMESIGMAANMLDSFLDGRMDFKNGDIALEPDGRYYRTTLFDLYKYGNFGGRALFHPVVSKEIGRMAWLRATNRLKHGMSDTSNLRIFGR